MSDNNIFEVDFSSRINEKNLLEVNGYTRQAIMEETKNSLSCYEVVCSPRRIKDEDKVVITEDKINRILREVLRCNICYQIYDNPVNIKSCVHTFCKTCIEDYNRRIKKECVICRHPIETRRCMKEDNLLKEISIYKY